MYVDGGHASDCLCFIVPCSEKEQKPAQLEAEIEDFLAQEVADSG